MKNTTILALCLLLIINYITYVESSCTSDCNDDCNTSDCLNGCTTNCQPPCLRKCNKNINCRTKCDVKEVVEPEPKKLKEPRDYVTKISNVNDIKNNYNVDINPNITMTNTITHVNNVSVPINVTSVNINNIRVSTSDSTSSQINITARDADCSGRNSPPSCPRNQKQIVILPYPQYRTPQIVTPPPQASIIVQPANPRPVQPRPTIIQPMPQYYWFSQQYMRPPQQTVITQPQQQMIYSTHSQPCGAPEGQCGSYCINQPCSQGQQVIPTNFPLPISTTNGMMYALSSPFVPSNQISQYSGINPFESRNGFTQYGSVSSFGSRNGLAQIGPLNSYGSTNGRPQFTDVNSDFIGQIPVGVDSYFIPDKFSRNQIQAKNFGANSKY